MNEYRINTECGLSAYEAETIDDAKERYAEEENYDFAGAVAGEYPGSWFWISENGVRVEDFTQDMP